MTQAPVGSELERAQRALCSEVALLKVRAGELGMYRTAQALEVVMKEVGWELADKLKRHGEDYGRS